MNNIYQEIKEKLAYIKYRLKINKLDNVELAIQYLNSNWKFLYSINPHLLNDKGLMLFIIYIWKNKVPNQEDERPYYVLDELFKNKNIALFDDLEFMQQAVKEELYLLKFCTDRVKNNPEIANIAVLAPVPFHLNFLPEKFRDNTELMKIAVKKHPYCFECVSVRLKNDFDFVYYCLLSHKNSFSCVQAVYDSLNITYQCDQEIALTAASFGANVTESIRNIIKEHQNKHNYISLEKSAESLLEKYKAIQEKEKLQQEIKVQKNNVLLKRVLL